MNSHKDIPDIRLDKTTIRVVPLSEKKAEEIEYWKTLP